MFIKKLYYLRNEPPKQEDGRDFFNLIKYDEYISAEAESLKIDDAKDHILKYIDYYKGNANFLILYNRLDEESIKIGIVTISNELVHNLDDLLEDPPEWCKLSAWLGT